MSSSAPLPAHDPERDATQPGRGPASRPRPRPAARGRARALRVGLVAASVLAALAVPAGCLDQIPDGLKKTPAGPGAHVRFDLSARPLPSIPLPNDTATWPDPTSRTGLRINASLIAPTNIEVQARHRFSQMEGWGTFSPISVGFDLDRSDPEYAAYTGPALDLENVERRHQGDDYDFQDDAVYLVNLDTGVPQLLDLGSGNFDYILKKLDRYWANDTRQSERNLLFETIDETQGGQVTSYAPEVDSDFDGVLDKPNTDSLKACPPPDALCDNPESGDAYYTQACLDMRRARDRCIADHLLTWYERETDTLLVRPLLPLDEMSHYAIVLTDRLVDGRGHAVKSPFDFVYHATQREAAARVTDILNDGRFASYFGDLAGTGLDHVAFLWSFTTQPTVDDMKRLRDGLYGQGEFERWATEYPPSVEMWRAVGLTPNLDQGAVDVPGWQTSPDGIERDCPTKAENMFVVDWDGLKAQARDLFTEGFDVDGGPDLELLLHLYDSIDHMVIGTYKTPYLLEGGPQSSDPNASFNVNFATGEGEVTTDTVQFWIIVPKATEAHQQPFDINIYGHGYTGNFVEMLLYAGNMAKHGIATVGINAPFHGLTFDEEGTKFAARSILGGACYAPFFDAVTQGRTRDLNADGYTDSGGDFWSSYLFHTRDGVRQAILDHLQLVRILRAFGQTTEGMGCRDNADKTTPVKACDSNGDGAADLLGDFDADGVPDIGGPSVKYGTWGESLGGILSGIHGAIDAYVTSAVPTSGGGGLSDIGIRSFQGGVIEAVLLRMWGPLLVTVPASTRKVCNSASKDKDRCTICPADDLSLRWVLPDVNGTGEVEVDCIQPEDIADSTVLVRNLANDQVRCASVDDKQRFRVGLPATFGDSVIVSFWKGRDRVESYASCLLTGEPELLKTVETWGAGRFGMGASNGAGTASCEYATCSGFQGTFFGQGTQLVAPGAGYGEIRQSPALRRFIMLAQSALEPGDPISFAPYYALKPMTDPFGAVIQPHALIALNTIGDMNVPLNSGIAFGRAAGALPFLRPDQAQKYPDYLDYVTPQELYDELGGRTPNQELIERHVVEGITALARHPAEPACAGSQNAAPLGATFTDSNGQQQACYPTGCTAETESTSETRICYSDTHCEIPAGETIGSCRPNLLGQQICDEALWDADDVDEGKMLYYEQHSAVPLRLARLTGSAHAAGLEAVWKPRILGKPYGSDLAWAPGAPPNGRITALLDAYIIPEGKHCFENGRPCQAFDISTYLTNLVARFFQSDGTDLYYLSHPTSHHCLETATPTCDYFQP